MRAAARDRARHHAHAELAEVALRRSPRSAAGTLSQNGAGLALDQLHLVDAEVQQHRLLQPFVDLPAALAVRLGDAELAAFQAFDHALHRRPRRAVDLVRRQHRAALERAVDHELQLLDARPLRRVLLAVFLRRPCGRLLRSSLVSFEAGQQRFAQRLLLRVVERAGRARSVIWNTSSARSPKVAMRASCTRRRCVAQHLRDIGEQARAVGADQAQHACGAPCRRAIASKPTCGAMRKCRRWRGCARRAGRDRCRGRTGERRRAGGARRPPRDGATARDRPAALRSCRRSCHAGRRARAPAGSPGPARSSVATIAANRPSRSGECTNTSSAPALPLTAERARTRVSPTATPRSDAACQAIWSGRPRRKPSSRHAREQALATSPSSTPNAGEHRARGLVASRRCARRRRPDAPGRGAAPAASRCSRSASSRSFHAFHSLGEVPAMSAQVSRYSWSRRSRSATCAAKRWITSGSAMSCFCAVTDISRCWRTSHATSAVSAFGQADARCRTRARRPRRVRNGRRRGPWRCRGTGRRAAAAPACAGAATPRARCEKRSSALPEAKPARFLSTASVCWSTV